VRAERAKRDLAERGKEGGIPPTVEMKAKGKEEVGWPKSESRLNWRVSEERTWKGRGGISGWFWARQGKDKRPKKRESVISFRIGRNIASHCVQLLAVA
jgi:hypothetical protein